MDLVGLQERVDIAIKLGESYYREFKSAYQGKLGEKQPRNIKDVCENVGKELVAFANADGGELFIGIEDSGKVTGVPYSEDKVDKILSASKDYVMADTPLSIRRQNVIEYDGKTIIYFSVNSGSEFIHQTNKGTAFKRKDKDSVPTSVAKIQFSRDEVASRNYDREFNQFARIIDLDLSLTQSIGEKCTNIPNVSIEKFLQYVDLAEFDGDKLKLRNAALLLFAKDPNKWHSRLRVRLLKVNGKKETTAPDYNVKELADVSGNIFTLISDSWSALRPHLSRTAYSKDGLFTPKIDFPEEACREALINAITHRDYSIQGRGIEIRIFDDRLEVLSPGDLLSKISISDLNELKGVHESRNTFIARVLREYGYIRELGEGIRRMFQLMKESELVPPQLNTGNKSFRVSLFYNYSYTDEEKLWLQHFESLNLSRDEKTVVCMGMNNRVFSTDEVMRRTEIVDTDKFRDLVDGLYKKNILKRTVSKQKVIARAKQLKISNKSIPSYSIVLPRNSKSSNKVQKVPVTQKSNTDYSKFIMISNIQWVVTLQEIKNSVETYGEVVNIDWLDSNDTSKKAALVEFKSSKNAQLALSRQDKITLNGIDISIKSIE